MLILGIDPGLVNVGWAVLSVGEGPVELVACGVGSLVPSGAAAEDVVLIADGALQFVGELAERFALTEVHIEEQLRSTGQQRNSGYNSKQWGAYQALVVAARVYGLPVVTLGARLVKTAFGIPCSGHYLNKRLAVAAVGRLGFNCDGIDHVADAILLALVGHDSRVMI